MMTRDMAVPTWPSRSEHEIYFMCLRRRMMRTDGRTDRSRISISKVHARKTERYGAIDWTPLVAWGSSRTAGSRRVSHCSAARRARARKTTMDDIITFCRLLEPLERERGGRAREGERESQQVARSCDVSSR